MKILYLLLELLSAFPEVFMIMFIIFLISFILKEIKSNEEEKKRIRRMNFIRYSSDKLTDDELMEFIEKSSIGEFERIGYMAAFADRHLPRKNLAILAK